MRWGESRVARDVVNIIHVTLDGPVDIRCREVIDQVQ